MKFKIDIPSVGKDVWLAAALLAGIMGLTFNVNAFCAASSLKDNRHTRAALNAMVAAGYLAKAKRKGKDGHWRTEYCAQKTARLG